MTSEASANVTDMDGDAWMDGATQGWVLAERGKWKQAYEKYAEADKIMRDYGYACVLNPRLQLLRHGVGEAEGTMFPLPPIEDQVVSVQWEDGQGEEPSAEGFKSYDIDVDVMAGSIRELVDREYQGPHNLNLKGDGEEDIQVLSTGRCGTVSLYHLLELSQYSPYHTFFYHIPRARRYEMACSILAGDVSHIELVAQYWIRSKSAELVGCENVGRPMFNLNHMDTTFAPIFASIRPKSRFIHLYRDPLKVFRSFYTKNQWSHNQILPLYFSLNPFKFKFMRYDTPTAIAWYVRWTEAFAQAMSAVIGFRMMELSSDKLFAGDREEIERMIDYCELPMSVADIQKHYRIPYNTKSHKVTMSDEQVAAMDQTFIDSYKAFGGVL